MELTVVIRPRQKAVLDLPPSGFLCDMLMVMNSTSDEWDDLWDSTHGGTGCQEIESDESDSCVEDNYDEDSDQDTRALPSSGSVFICEDED